MKNKIMLPIVIILLVSLTIVGTIFITDKQKENDNQDNITEKSETNSQAENNNDTSNEKNASNTQTNSIVGRYQKFENIDNHYAENYLTFTNQTDSSIDFDIIAGEGRNVDHVSVGDLKGTANLVNIPQEEIIPSSTQYAYQYIENIDGKDYKITFVYTAHKKSIYVTIIEDYPDNFNPYGGHGVHFGGEYEKIWDEN